MDGSTVRNVDRIAKGEAPLHVDAAAQAALLSAVERGTPGIYNIAEDDGAVSVEKAKRGGAWLRRAFPHHDLNGLLRNREPFSRSRHGFSIALVMPMRAPRTISAFPSAARNSNGALSSGRPLCLMLFPALRVICRVPSPATDRRRHHAARIRPMPTVGSSARIRLRWRCLFLADEVDAPVDTVGTVDIDDARRPKHHDVAWRRSP